MRTKNWTVKEGNYGRRKVKETRIEVLPQAPQRGEGTWEMPPLPQRRVLRPAQKRGRGTRWGREARRPAAGGPFEKMATGIAGFAAQSIRTADAIADGPAGSGQWINSDSLDRCRKKGRSPDDSAREGFFGATENEMFYNSGQSRMAAREFVPYPEKCLIWLRERGIEESLGCKSVIDSRREIGISW